MSGNFVWRDAGRTVIFDTGGVVAAPQLLAAHGIERFELFTTRRHLGTADGLAAAAAAVHELPPADPATAVPETAAALLDSTGAANLVALGGGRTIDTAKAIAAVTGAAVAAIPTTMSGAEMTGIHRLPAGAEDRVRSLVRPALVIADPVAMTSAPEPELRASSMNALAHGADSLYTPFANPVSRLTALRGAELIATALDEGPAERNRAALAQGSILCGYAIDSGSFSLHHVVCQTLVRICGAAHAGVNAAILPRAMAFMAPRAPDRLEPLATAIGTTPESIEPRLLELGGDPPGLGDQGADPDKLPEAVEAMLLRPELAFTPEPPTQAD
ncbi:MAG TPA: iron-containing alcohol dehydrogenase, partial [Solirubrobacterales bacterium]|nr:iron-containing alcohol dehydrogenase [Solirubrobacterales bacterium]